MESVPIAARTPCRSGDPAARNVERQGLIEKLVAQIQPARFSRRVSERRQHLATDLVASAADRRPEVDVQILRPAAVLGLQRFHAATEVTYSGVWREVWLTDLGSDTAMADEPPPHY